MIRPFLLFLLWVPLALPSFAFEDRYELAARPDWVQELSLPATQPSATDSYPSDIILRDRQVMLGDKPVRYARDVTRPLTAAGISGTSELAIPFNPAFQHLQLHRLAIWRNGKMRDVTQSARVRLVQREESLNNGIQDGEVTALISPDDVQVGDMVDLSYSVLGRNPIFNRNAGFLALELEVPVHLLNIRIIGSPGRSLHIQTHDGKVAVSKENKGNSTEYKVSLRDVKAVVSESSSPPWRNGYRWLEYSEYANWADVADWGKSLYDIPATASPGFDALYQRLAATSVTQEDFVRAALRYTQNEVRYLGLEFGENSHRPNPPELVIERRFGDCKDKALLLSRLLQRHKIQAAPALVSTGYREGVASSLAGPGLFDHVITLVKLDGKHYWLDGTNLYQTGLLNTLGQADYGYALVLDGQSRELTRMYEAPTIGLSTAVEEHYEMDDLTGPVRLSVQTRYHGSTAEWYRYYFNNTPLAMVQKRQLDYYSRFIDGIKVSGTLRYQDDADANIFTVNETYIIPAFWRRAKEKLNANMVLLAFEGVLERPQEVNRRNPLLLSRPRFISSKTYMHFPIDVPFKVDTNLLQVDGAGFNYSAKDRYYNKTYYHQAELTIIKPLIEAEELPKFLRGLKTMNDDMDFHLSLPFPESSGYNEVIELRSRYQEKSGVSKQ